MASALPSKCLEMLIPGLTIRKNPNNLESVTFSYTPQKSEVAGQIATLKSGGTSQDRIIAKVSRPGVEASVAINW